MYPRLANFDGSNRLVIYLHGAGGWAQMFAPSASENFLTADVRAGLRELADEGYVILHPKFGGAHTWGNDLSLGLIDDWIDYMFTHPLCSSQTKVAFVGLSMGGGSAFNYAVRNQARVAGVATASPWTNLVHQYNGGVQGNGLDGFFPNEINTAYGLPAGPPDSNNSPTLDATVKAERDPLTRASELNGVIPWYVHYNTDDNVIDAATSTAQFVSDIGATSTTGTGGHYIWNPDMDVMKNFLAGLTWS